MYALGPRAQRVYLILRDRLQTLSPGSQLPPLVALAKEFGVAPLTVRQVIARLEEERYLVRIHGRGTFVRERTAPAVLIVEDDLPMRTLLAAHVMGAGYRSVEEATPRSALAALEGDPAIALVLSDVRMPTPEAGIAFIRTVRRRWPNLPLAAVTGYPEDLISLHGTPDSPVLILPKPLWAHQIAEVLHLVLRSTSRVATAVVRDTSFAL